MSINLSIQSLGSNFVDLRESIAGDSYNWSWIRPLSQVNYLAIHHSAGSDTQTPNEIANYHINNNSWGGIGYHFLISKDGVVYYVGDLSTARANVANLNEQIIGICLVGNFTSNRTPTQKQYISAHKLCDFFINNFPDLVNIKSWDALKGHKELPGQQTICPGDNWPSWRSNIVSGVGLTPSNGGIIFNPPINPTPSADRDVVSLKSQVDSLQITLASVNQQVIFLQEAVREKDQQIKDLKMRISISPQVASQPSDNQFHPDKSVTLIGALINLYKFIFPAPKEQ